MGRLTDDHGDGGTTVYVVSLGAVRRRSGPAVLLLVLAGLAAVVAAAAPWYGLAVATRAAAADVAAVPAAQREITVHRTGETGGDPRGALAGFAAGVRGMLALPGVEPRLGLAADMSYRDPRRAGTPTSLPVAYLDGFCAGTRLTGSCPAGAGEVAISAASARRLGLSAGSALAVRPTDAVTPVRLRVTAVYERPEWTDPLFLARGDQDPAFTPLDTFRQIPRATLGYDLAVPESLLRGDNGYDLAAAVARARPKLAADQLELADPTGPLLAAVRADRADVRRGVLIALGQAAVLAWFAIGLAGRLTGRDRREDAGLLKLRGSTGGGMLRLALGQHLVPLLGGALAGLPAGVAAAWLLAGRLPVRAEWWPALLLAVAAVAAVLLGGLLVLTAVDALAHRAPVVALLRRVPSARRDWRSAVADAALVALAAGAVYQARSGGPDRGLGMAAPALVALAVGLLLARLLRNTADRAGGAAVRAGRLRSGLTAVQMSRQPGTDRVFALLVVAVAMLATAAGGLAAGRAARADRADVELGAARVLTVAATSRTQLQYAVHRADPGGRDAMAAVIDRTSNPPLLAVDTARLAAVATWRPEYGPVTALPATAPVAVPLITGRRLDLRVASERPGSAVLGAVLTHESTGAAVRIEFGGIRRGEQTVSAAVPACAEAPGCRLVSWQLYPSTGPDGQAVAGALTLRGLTQAGPAGTVLDAARLAEVSRWHTDVAGLAVRIAATGRGLSLAAGDQPGKAAGTGVYAVETPLPLPIVLAGRRPTTWRFDDATSASFGSAATPVRLAGTARLLPVLGGSGMLADLESVRRLDADGGTYQVWLRAGAPGSVVDALRRDGLTVLADQTARGRAGALGADRTDAYTLFAVAAGLLIAAVVAAVAAAADRPALAEQLRALRTQGLSRPAARGTAVAGGAALTVAGLCGGLLAALVAGPVTGTAAPPFPDGWRIVPPPAALGPPALALAGAVALLVLGATAWLSARPLIRRLP